MPLRALLSIRLNQDMRRTVTLIASNDTAAGRGRLLFELILYLLFLALFVTWTSLAHGSTRGEAFLLTSAMDQATTNRMFVAVDGQQITFRGINSEATMYYWLQNTLLASVVQESWPNGAAISPASEAYYVAGSSKLLGGMRLRLLRVRDQTCDVDPVYASVIGSCHAPYDEALEDTSAFGPNKVWTYSSAEANKESMWLGKYAAYSGAGMFFLDTYLLANICVISRAPLSRRQMKYPFLESPTFFFRVSRICD